MKVYKTLFWITFISGLIIFLVGVYLKIFNQFSDGSNTGITGEIHYGMITGYSGMFLGIVMFLLSIWTYNIYKEEKRKFDKME